MVRSALSPILSEDRGVNKYDDRNPRLTWLPWRWKYRPRPQPDGTTLTLLPPEPVRQNYKKWAERERAISHRVSCLLLPDLVQRCTRAFDDAPGPDRTGPDRASSLAPRNRDPPSPASNTTTSGNCATGCSLTS